ncbi:endonuclease/exonuclease/phosphatase family protein [Mycobacterium deserti]|uniref:Endonuclease/exonuclease/phosphatase family protein n=1 Tax=Mycobacterium deserti TaxID=2978347 RepID=A0ABT2M7M5_9MYCO|nr:endonuclease/exonuclease/phosphatase family protein [Mycobacterium deserti]MCT7658273.1 endonuclease/exonuclease/phosphatase family protein [Mycobacterium deserti]
MIVPVAGKRVWTALGVVASVVAVAALAVRSVPIVNRALIVTAALAPYLMVGAPVAMIVFAFLRRWVAAVVAVVLTVAAAAVQAPLFVGEEAPSGVAVRFVSANLRYGHADPVAVTELARENADMLAVQELTPEAAQRLSAAGLDREFPHQALRAREGPAGVGIWSRFPIVNSEADEGFWLGLLTARVRVPDVPDDVTVVTTHMSAPWPEPIAGWRDDMARLASALRGIAAESKGAVLVAGDLNSTTDMREFRRLLREGYRDAAEQAGAGLTRTHPADIAVPPVFPIDHVLVRGGTATSVRTPLIGGSDHRALVADVILAP